MDENNDNVNRLNTVLGVEEDKSAGSKINNFVKKLKGIPESREVPLRPRADFRKANKELTQNLKKWEKFGKKQAGNPLVNYFFGDKNRVKATKRLFADLEKTARKSTQKYNNKLNDLLGADREKHKGNGFDYNGQLGDVKTAHDNNIKSRTAKQEQLNELTKEYNTLLDKQKQLSLRDKEASIIGNMEKARKDLAELEKQRDDVSKGAFDSVQPMKIIDTNSKLVTDRNKELSKLAAGLYSRTGDESLFKTLEKEINSSMKVDEQSLNNVVTKLQSANGKKGALTKKLNALQKQQKQSPSDATEKAITNIKSEIAKADATIKKLNRDKKVAEGYLKLDKKQKAQYDSYYANKDKPQDFGKNKDYRDDEFAPKFDAMMRKKTSAIKEMVDSIGALNSPKALTDINKDIDNTYNNIAKLQIQLQEVTAEKTDVDVSGDNEDSVNKQIEEKRKTIDEINNALNKEKQAGKELVNIYSKLKLEVKEASRELKLIRDDTQIDPFKYNLEASDLQGYNDKVEDIKNGVAGIGSNWKKSNVFTRLLGRMLINIRSQIADMFNPFTKFRQGWDSWLNRAENLPWKNTFDVIAYNLVTALAPVFEWIAKSLVKVAQVANVFIKRWFGVDLFDKSAWSLEQMKKGMGQLTASFDELHSNTDNPNQFNTIFDTDPAAVTPLSEELTSKLEKWADRIANAFKWIKDNWLILVGLWAGFKIAKGLLGLLDWAGKLKDLLGGIAGIKFGTVLSGLAAVAGTALGVYGTYKQLTKWNQMNDKEKTGAEAMTLGGFALGGAGIGGLIGSLFGPGGTLIGATIGAGIGTAIGGGIDAAIAAWHGEDTRREITGTIGGTGLGMGIGAAIGTAICPGIGTAVGAGIGAVIGGITSFVGEKAITAIWSNGGPFSNLKISQDDLAWATEQTSVAAEDEYKALLNLKQIEEQTGQSGKELYDAVQNGTLSYENMTSTQLEAAKAYETWLKAHEKTAEAKKVQTDYSNAILFNNAKQSDSYGELVTAMIKAKDDGIYTEEELRDRLSQVYAELDEDSRSIFLESVPESMRQGVEDGAYQYYSGWEKFKIEAGKKWEEFKGNAVQLWEDIKTGAIEKWDNFKTSASTAWENVKTTVGTKLGELKDNAVETWDNIKTKAGEKWEEIKNSAVGKKVQEIATNVSTKWNELKSNTTQKFQDIASKANEKWQSIKSTITTKANDAWTNAKSKWEQLKTDSKNAFDNVLSNAKTKFGDIAKTIGDKAKEAWDKAKGWFEDIGKKAKEAWDGVKNWGSNIGKGWETEGFGGAVKATFGLKSYDVGTNYVPNDQLAMVHKGEAIIPAKYNKPYSPQSNNSDLEYTIAAMTQEISNLRSLIQSGIPVKGEFKQRGSDLVAVVEKGKNRNGNQTLSNPAYAR